MIFRQFTRNPRVGGDKPLAEFVKVMKALNLAYPKFIDYAVPGNRECGKCPDGVPDDLNQYCDQIAHCLQGDWPRFANRHRRVRCASMWTAGSSLVQDLVPCG